ncbi:hypothetical protein TARUN_6097 [Trichoderma arundinaceum]|uniref:BTB domain-containing protein n=1 Tax=Trichoderma arundinaceum TaxID=490622 RepID=A0A395NJ69_TRIAR|nr:hypothetical protein TARUN_6097 [Trichoderma arundinaceum]
MATLQNGVDLRQLMQSGQFSDLTFVCQGQEFKIHKLVVCSQSPVLAAAIKGQFKEAQTGVIQIDGFDVETVRRMVEFLYMGDYDIQHPEEDKAVTAAPSGANEEVNLDPEATSTAPLVPAQDTLHHVRVNAIADYYDVQGLALLATQKIRLAYQSNWDAKAFLSSAIEALGATGDESLHGMLALLAAQNLEELLKSEPCQLATLFGDFGLRFVRSYVRVLEDAKKDQIQHLLQQQSCLESRCRAADAKTNRATKSIEKIIALTNGRNHCRNGACKGVFQSYIELLGDSEQTYILRQNAAEEEMCRGDTAWEYKTGGKPL